MGVRAAGKGNGRTLLLYVYLPIKLIVLVNYPVNTRGAHARVGNMHFTIIVKITTAATQHANFLHANGLRERPVVYLALLGTVCSNAQYI